MGSLRGGRLFQFQSTGKLPAELELDFRKRSAAFRDFVRLYPDATLQELAAYRQRIRPQDPGVRKLFTQWCISKMKDELGV